MNHLKEIEIENMEKQKKMEQKEKERRELQEEQRKKKIIEQEKKKEEYEKRLFQSKQTVEENLEKIRQSIEFKHLMTLRRFNNIMEEREVHFIRRGWRDHNQDQHERGCASIGAWFPESLEADDHVSE